MPRRAASPASGAVAPSLLRSITDRRRPPLAVAPRRRRDTVTEAGAEPASADDAPPRTRELPSGPLGRKRAPPRWLRCGSGSALSPHSAPRPGQTASPAPAGRGSASDHSAASASEWSGWRRRAARRASAERRTRLTGTAARQPSAVARPASAVARRRVSALSAGRRCPSAERRALHSRTLSDTSLASPVRPRRPSTASRGGTEVTFLLRSFDGSVK